jgi:hypothetical protein
LARVRPLLLQEFLQVHHDLPLQVLDCSVRDLRCQHAAGGLHALKGTVGPVQRPGFTGIVGLVLRGGDL